MQGRWTREEYESLKIGVAPPGRSRRAIKRALVKIGARKPLRRRKPWSRRHLKILRDMRARGMSAEDIAKSGNIPKSLNAIQKKLCRMGLANRIKILKFNGEQRDELRDFLKRSWEGKTPQDLAEMWNEKHPALKIGRRRVISYLTALGLKIHYGEVQRINNARKKEKAIVSSGLSPSQIAEAVKRHRAIFMRKRIELGRDIWTGMPLPQDALEE